MAWIRNIYNKVTNEFVNPDSRLRGDYLSAIGKALAPISETDVFQHKCETIIKEAIFIRVKDLQSCKNIIRMKIELQRNCELERIMQEQECARECARERELVQKQQKDKEDLEKQEYLRMHRKYCRVSNCPTCNIGGITEALIEVAINITCDITGSIAGSIAGNIMYMEDHPLLSACILGANFTVERNEVGNTFRVQNNYTNKVYPYSNVTIIEVMDVLALKYGDEDESIIFISKETYDMLPKECLPNMRNHKQS